MWQGHCAVKSDAGAEVGWKAVGKARLVSLERRGPHALPLRRRSGVRAARAIRSPATTCSSCFAHDRGQDPFDPIRSPTNLDHGVGAGGIQFRNFCAVQSVSVRRRSVPPRGAYPLGVHI
jgi:hypothetical protein